MAVRAAAANTGFTTSTTWGLVDATSYNNAESANTLLTTSPVASSAFTPGAITVDGVAVKIASRAASPTGTFTIELFNSTGTVSVASVTVNVSDVPTCTATSGTNAPVTTAEGGWFFVKFGSSQLLIAATNYTVRLSTSSSNQINVWSAATTNWSRYLRTTTTGAPAAGDDLIITGEWTAAATVTARTVTMDETATTDYGSNTTSQVTPSLAICKSGTLTYGTTASTNYNLRQSGFVIVYNGGTYNQGSSGAEIPRNSTAVLQFDCAVDGDFGMVVRNGGVANFYGLSRTSGKNFSQTKLNANASAGATSITIVDDTGWLSGDELCFAPTSRTFTEFESKAATGNATATTMAVTALTNAHSGTSPTQGEVGLLTRNNRFNAVTAGLTTFLYVGTTAVVNGSWTDFRYFGANAAGKRGISISTVTGACNLDFCTIRDTDNCGWYVEGTNPSNFTLTNSIIYNTNITGFALPPQISVSTTSTNWVINNCMFCGTTGATNVCLSLADIGGTVTNCSFSGCSNTNTGALSLSEVATNLALGTFNHLEVHSNNGVGIGFNSGSFTGTLDRINSWRNGQTGITFSTNFTLPVTITNSNFFGNVAGIAMASEVVSLLLDTCTVNGDTSFTCTNGITGPGAGSYLTMVNTTFSVVSGIKTQCTTDINYGGGAGISTIITDGCTFNATTLFANGLSSVIPGPFLKCQNYGGVANSNRTYYSALTSNGPNIIQTNTSTVYGTNIRSEQISCVNANLKQQSNSILVPCGSGKVATPIVQVQKNSGYNGNAPRLILKRQDCMGVTADTVLQTFSSGANVWQALTGATPTALQDGVFEFVVDCDGTAGSVFVGDATATVA